MEDLDAPGEFHSSALISYGMNKEIFMEIDNNAPFMGSCSGGQSKKAKGSPSSNLPAEWKHRAKLSERLISLWSVVPKITKLDRASTLGDAIDHIKDLSDKINKLKLELESAPLPTPAVAPIAAQEEASQHPTRIEVRKREGGIVIIHMRCSWRPGLLHSIAKTLNNLGIDSQDVVYNCLDGFILNLYRGQQSSDVPEDQIKAMLLETVRNHGVA
ncbi:transcription factor SCREAM2-like [Bidens hawaiensis]|uniref:transcription factor SCREAM2-like n=1 Tax=Bidens hawaiensis TaxID=980011 RepID=UPI00404AA273